jgi:alcohol dehydrogenase class IV
VVCPKCKGAMRIIISIADPSLIRAILFPDFTVSMPPKLTAGTGLDVPAHAMDTVARM